MRKGRLRAPFFLCLSEAATRARCARQVIFGREEPPELRHHDRLAVALLVPGRSCAAVAGSGRSGKRAHCKGAQKANSHKHGSSPWSVLTPLRTVQRSTIRSQQGVGPCCHVASGRLLAPHLARSALALWKTS